MGLLLQGNGTTLAWDALSIFPLGLCGRTSSAEINGWV